MYECTSVFIRDFLEFFLKKYNEFKTNIRVFTTFITPKNLIKNANINVSELLNPGKPLKISPIFSIAN